VRPTAARAQRENALPTARFSAGPTQNKDGVALRPEDLVIAFETGLRFLTDHVAGDLYFRIERPNQNLDRCRNQFRLLTALESDSEALDASIEAAWRE
jgi:hypothetical protein